MNIPIYPRTEDQSRLIFDLKAKIEDLEETVRQAHEVLPSMTSYRKMEKRLNRAIEMLARNTGLPFSEVWLTVAEEAEQ